MVLADPRRPWGPAERAPVLRTGERDPINPYKRRLIYTRDGWRCLFCSIEPADRQLSLDHIRPWSSFPPGTPARVADRSTNLRTLCLPCNLGRSNLTNTDPVLRVIVGVVKSCCRCHSFDPPSTAVRVFCGGCMAGGYAPEVWVL